MGGNGACPDGFTEEDILVEFLRAQELFVAYYLMEEQREMEFLAAFAACCSTAPKEPVFELMPADIRALVRATKEKVDNMSPLMARRQFGEFARLGEELEADFEKILCGLRATGPHRGCLFQLIANFGMLRYLLPVCLVFVFQSNSV